MKFVQNYVFATKKKLLVWKDDWYSTVSRSPEMMTLGFINYEILELILQTVSRLQKGVGCRFRSRKPIG